MSFSQREWRRWCELLLLAAILGYFAVSPALPDFPLCPFRHFLGSSCPTCGTTRSVWAILHGNFAAAWGFNPIGFVVVVALIRRLPTLLLPKVRWIQIANGDVPNVLLLAAFFALGYAQLCHVV